MNEELRNISEHIKAVGLGFLSQAQKNAFFWDSMYCPQLKDSVFGVVQAAHAAELLLKARIAEEHPLLIFSQIPKSSNVKCPLLDFDSLLQQGRTLDFNELPERLWATTGYKMEHVEVYNNFGKLRNAIQHFAVPDENLEARAGEFIYKVLDPAIGHFWDLYAIDYCDYVDHYDYLPEVLIRNNIEFRHDDSWNDTIAQIKEDCKKND